MSKAPDELAVVDEEHAGELARIAGDWPQPVAVQPSGLDPAEQDLRSGKLPGRASIQSKSAIERLIEVVKPLDGGQPMACQKSRCRFLVAMGDDDDPHAAVLDFLPPESQIAHRLPAERAPWVSQKNHQDGRNQG